jgi:hypothetical protein
VALEGKWRAILIGGLITGLGPFVPILNLACCVFPILGSIVAVAVYRSSSLTPPTNNDGVILGVMTGVVGTLIYGLLLGPVTLIFGGILQSFLSAAVPCRTLRRRSGLFWNSFSPTSEPLWASLSSSRSSRGSASHWFLVLWEGFWASRFSNRALSLFERQTAKAPSHQEKHLLALLMPCGLEPGRSAL